MTVVKSVRKQGNAFDEVISQNKRDDAARHPSTTTKIHGLSYNKMVAGRKAKGDKLNWGN